MDKEYLAIIESLFTDIRDNSDNPDLVTGLLSQLKNTINEFFANLKKYLDDWLVSDYTSMYLSKIYNALENPKYSEVTVNVSGCIDALSKYKEYIEGLEEYIKTVFTIQVDDNVSIDKIKEKNCFVFNKNQNYINGLFSDGDFNYGNIVSLSDGVSEFEMVLDYITHLDAFKNECMTLVDLINQEYTNKSNSGLFLIKTSSSSIYIYSIMYFNNRIAREVMCNVDSIHSAIESIDRPVTKETVYKMF